MKKILIQDKLRSMNVDPDEIMLGDFDYMGEFTAKKLRDNKSDLWKKGAFARTNYERGILIYYLIKQYNLKSYMEIGFGRGYSTICAAKALYDSGVREPGSVTTIDPVFSEEHLKIMSQVFSHDWLNLIKFVKGTSEAALTQLTNETYDFIYIDGDHTESAVQLDWNMCKNKWNCFLLFDDYNKDLSDPNIQCSKVIDLIDDQSKELIIMDRRMFHDDRGLKDEDVKYGQVLLTNESNCLKLKNSTVVVEPKQELWDW